MATQSICADFQRAGFCVQKSCDKLHYGEKQKAAGTLWCEYGPKCKNQESAHRAKFQHRTEHCMTPDCQDYSKRHVFSKIHNDCRMLHKLNTRAESINQICGNERYYDHECGVMHPICRDHYNFIFNYFTLSQHPQQINAAGDAALCPSKIHDKLICAGDNCPYDHRSVCDPCPGHDDGAAGQFYHAPKCQFGAGCRNMCAVHLVSNAHRCRAVRDTDRCDNLASFAYFGMVCTDCGDNIVRV